MPERSRNWDEAVSSRRMSLIELLRKSADGPQVLAEAMEALEELDRLHRSLAPVESDGSELGDQSGKRRRRQRPTETASRFVVERTLRGAYLAEHFSTNRQPFRCPESIYNKTSVVMSKVKKPVLFEELLANVRHATEDALPDYLLRVCLRFWQGTTPPLVEKHRARYKPARPSQFGRDARRAWKKLAGRAE